MKNRQRSKSVERNIAKRIPHARRVGILGSEDIQHPVFSFEVKSRRVFVGANWYKQAVRNCPRGKYPSVIVHVHGQRYNNDLVIMSLRDFEDWLGTIQLQPEDQNG